MNKVVVGSRGSKLALIQAGHVIDSLRGIAPEQEFELKIIKTTGDKILDTPLARIGDKGLFVKEIENALLQREIDLAVHSMKDVPTRIQPGLTIAAITKREDPRDVLLSGSGQKLMELPAGATLGTGSLRRVAQLLHLRPDLTCVPVRGNLETRLGKLKEQQFSALVLAYAGLKRLGRLELLTEIIPVNLCLPAVGQGALGIEMREGDTTLEQLILSINDSSTHAAVLAERAFLRKLEGGCQVPIGALGEIRGGKLHLQGIIAALDGSTVLRDEERGNASAAEQVGLRLAEKLLARGGASILEKVRRDFNNNG